MATEIAHHTQVGFRQPLSVPIGTRQTTIQDNSHHPNQLQFNMQSPYSITSLASNFTKPQPLVIEKIPSQSTTEAPVIHHSPIPSSPASSISSERLHFAVQLAKMDAKKMKENKELVQCLEQDQDVFLDGQGKKMAKPSTFSTRKDIRRHTSNYRDKVVNDKYWQSKSRNDNVDKRHIPGYRLGDTSEDNVQNDDKQTKEIRRLEKQIQKYLEKLDELIQKGQEVIHKKDRRLRRNPKDDVSHLSDEDTDPRQFERADEQATRSARVLYMVERQIRELDDELNKKSTSKRHEKKHQTRGRLAAAQRATVRALQMLINSAPLQPKGSLHYRSMYQELTSLIQQLSLLSIQLENEDVVTAKTRKPGQITIHDDFAKVSSKIAKHKFEPPKREPEVGKQRMAFRYESSKPKDRSFFRNKDPVFESNAFVRDTRPSKEDSTLSINQTPERNATLKAGLEALLRVKQLEEKPNKIVPQNVVTNPKKKAVLWPPSLQAKRRKANLAVQKSVKFSVESAHFTKDTTASRLKKIEKQKLPTNKDGWMKDDHDKMASTSKSVATSPRNIPGKMAGFHEELQEREIKRQMWLEDEAKRKLREVMDMPNQLVSEAEKAIKLRLKPLLEQAEAVVESSKTKPFQERFVDLASKVTMKESENLSEMILDDLLTDTVEEFQRLEDIDDDNCELTALEDNSTLENILQRLEQFEAEEESIRRRWTHVSYADPVQSNIRPRNCEKKSIGMEARLGEGAIEPHPIVIESANTTTIPTTSKETPANKTLPLRFTTTSKNEWDSYNGQHSKFKTDWNGKSTLTRPQEDAVFHVSLPPKIRENIFSYRQKYGDYLEKANAQRQGTFEPWKVVERLSDDILDDVIGEVAEEFCGACDDVTELVFQSEFMKEEI